MSLNEYTSNFVDVVILSWNRVESTIQTIENVLAQTYPKVKIWIVDQGSSKDTIQLLKSFIKDNDKISLVELNQNYGVAGGRNRGMKLGKGEIIICLDNDAVFETNDDIQKTIDKFKSDENLAIIGYRIKNYYTKIADRANWVYARQLHEKNNKEFLTTRFCGAGHAIRRNSLNETNYYDERLFFYWEELDLSYQMINHQKKVIYYPDVNILHKINPEQRINWKSNRYYYLVRNALYLDWKYYRNPFRILFLSSGYFLKGLFNNLFLQTVKGIITSFSMMSKYNDPTFKLSTAAKVYIYDNDTAYRGTLISRLRFEILEKLK